MDIHFRQRELEGLLAANAFFESRGVEQLRMIEAGHVWFWFGVFETPQPEPMWPTLCQTMNAAAPPCGSGRAKARYARLRSVAPAGELGLAKAEQFTETFLHRQACSVYQSAKMRDLPCKLIQLDEIWSFVGCKEKAEADAVDQRHPGDVWTWTSICAETKLIAAWRVGDRSSRTAFAFCDDLEPPIQWHGANHERRAFRLQIRRGLDIRSRSHALRATRQNLRQRRAGA